MKNNTAPYKLNLPEFEGTTFTESAKARLSWPDAVKFAESQNAILQSLREAAAFRVEAEGKDRADEFQITRTSAVYFKEGGKFYVAFDDTPNPSKNIVLARVNEGYRLGNAENRKWMLPRSDTHIEQIVERAEASKRIIQLADGPFELAKSSLELTTHINKGSSEFGRNNAVQALFGDVAEPYAEMLHKRENYRYNVYTWATKNLNKLIDAQNAIVTPVALGVFIHDSGVGANTTFSFTDGHARGVYNPTEWKR